MKKLYTTLALALLAVLAFAQTPNISMTTTLSINSQISFTIRGNSGSTPIQIDWGNGVKENYTIGDMDEAFGFPVKGSTIKIWGQGVEGLNIQSKELTAMEFYQATSLKTLFCKGNKLTTLNLTDCPALTLVECKQNQITSLTLPSTTTLTYVDCSDNNLNLVTLLIKQATWTDYIYSPQKDYTLEKTVYAVNEEIDLSSQLTVNGNTTTYTWKTIGGTTLVNGTDYNATGGKFTFLKTYTETLFCELTNASFPSLTYKTTSISIPALPAVVMTTTTAIGNSFYFIIRSLVNNTPVRVDWGDGILSNYNIITSNSIISGTLKSSTIKVYGEGINYIDVISKNLTSIDASNCSTLQYFFCKGNDLISIDVSKNSSLIRLNISDNLITNINLTKNLALVYLECYNNKFTNLDVSKNTALTLFDCSQNLLTTLDVTKNIAMKNLTCHSNQLYILDVTTNTAITYLGCAWNQLTNLDITNNTALTYLGCAWNQLTTLDLSKNSLLSHLSCSYNKLNILDIIKNTALTALECSDNYLTTLDISKNTALNYLNCNRNQLTALDVSLNTNLTSLNCYTNKINTLDVSKNTALTYLHCASTNITTLDISKNTLLTDLLCSSNQLSALDVTKNTALAFLECSYNQLNFSSLPIKQSAWTTYIYSPQKNYALAKTIYAVNEEIDLSGQLNVDGNTTTYIWETAGGVTLVKNIDYTELNGKFTFPAAQRDYLYCQMTNASFPDLTLTTETISVPSTEPTITMTTTKTIGSAFSFGIAATANNKPIQVDWGNGTLANYTIGSYANVSSTLTGSTIKIYGVGISYLDISNKSIITLDITGAPALRILYCDNNQLNSLDLSKNTAITYLTCDNNQLTTLDMSKNTVLTFLSFSINSLTAIDLSKNTALATLWCDSNQLSGLDLSNNTALTSIYCKSNILNFATLPIKQFAWTTYIYSPQKNYALAKTIYAVNEEIDLSSQLTIGGNTTVYTWKTLGGNTLVKDLDYIENNGKFAFIKQPCDYFYCEMRNATFPNLTLSTVNISIALSEPIMSFTTLLPSNSELAFTLKANSNNRNVKIDWGNGDLVDYTIGTSSTNITGSLAGNTVKVFGLGITYTNVANKKINSFTINNASQTYLDCQTNNLTFATLPLKQQNWTTYTYSPQAKIKIDKKQFNLSETVDLSSQLTANSNTTSYIWKTKGGTTLTPGTDYSVTDGVTTFLKGQTDSIYCQMTNATFPLLTLSTTNIKVSDPTSIDSEFEQITKVYPNPVSNLLWVASEEAIKRVEIYTVVGAKVFEQNYNASQKASINTSDFPKGLLIIKVYGMNGVMEKKLLKE